MDSMRLRHAWTIPLVGLLACGGGGGDGSGPDSNPPPAATAHFDPPAPMAGAAWGAVPYPSDLFLDDTGHQKLLTVPAGPGALDTNVAALKDGLAAMTGAGVRSNVYFPIDGVLAKASVAGAATLYDLDASTAQQLVAVPADVLYREDLASVIVAPKNGVILRAGHRYGAILTRAATATNGAPLAPSADFTAAIDLATTPADPAVAAAQANLRPLLELLPGDVKGNLASATVFRTNDDLSDTVAMREVIAATTPTITIGAVYGPGETGPNGLQALVGSAPADDVPGTDSQAIGAQPHNHVAVIAHGVAQLPSFLSATAGEDGFPTFTGGVPTIKGTHPVKFTIALPRNSTWVDVPVAVFVHGLTRTRGDMMTVINTAARQGFAVIAIDLARHGDRAVTPVDVKNDLLGTGDTTTPTPDGIGDNAGLPAAIQFFHLSGNSGGIPGGHPRATGENLRQAAMEVVALVELIADGNWAPLDAALAPLTGVPDSITFRDDVALITESLGGMVTAPAIAVEPRIKSAYVSDPAAGLPFPAMMHSPNYGATFLGVLVNPFSLDGRIELWDPEKDARFDPIVMLFDTVIERGDSLTYARAMTDGSLRGGTPANLIMSMAWGDVWVSNDSTEAFAAAAGLGHMPMSGTEAPPNGLALVRSVTLPALASPVSGNLPGGRTGAFIVFNRAGHRSLRVKAEETNYSPIYPPFQALSPAEPINPTQTAQIHELIGEMLADQAANRAHTIRDPYD